MKNTEFVKPIADGLSYEFAPAMLYPNPGTPTAAEYLAAGWYRNCIEPPVPAEGKIVTSTLYVIDNDSVIAQYEYGDAPERVRVFSKLCLEEALFQRGLLNALDTFVDAQTIENENGQTMPLRRKYETANDFKSNHPVWQQFFEPAMSALGISSEVAEQILNEAEASS